MVRLRRVGLIVAALALFAAPALGERRGSLAESCRPVVRSQGFVGPDGAARALSDLAPGQPVALIVIKGHWCKACTRQLSSLSRRLEEIRKTGGAVAGLSTEDAGTNAMIMKKLGLRFPILGEPSAKLLERLGMWMPSMGHPLPGVVFLDACGDVAAKRRGRRPGVLLDDLILETLRDLAGRGGACAGRS